MRTVLKIAAGVLIAFVVLIVALGALVGSGIDKVEKDNQRTAVTAAQVARVHVGATRASVERALGKPDSSRTQVTNDSLGRTVTVYYPAKGGGLFDDWQINYVRGRVESVNKF